jgi:hypothetical protein
VTTIPTDAAAAPAGSFPGFETVAEWVAFEHGWNVCDYCGDTGPDVRPESVYVGGHGYETRYRCSRPNAAVGFVYAHQEVA